MNWLNIEISFVNIKSKDKQILGNFAKRWIIFKHFLYKQINDDANKSEKAWRPDNVALNSQAAHDRNIITNAKVKLEQELLKELQDDVEDLEKQVSALSYQIAENTANVKAKLQEEWDSSCTSTSEFCILYIDSFLYMNTFKNRIVCT